VIFTKIVVGNCLDNLKALPSNSIHSCVSSPPYFSLRNYGTEGQIGLEELPEEYVPKIVEVFSEVKRVLRKDGTLWLNLGDSWWNNYGGGSATMTTGNAQAVKARGRCNRPKHSFLKIKDLIGIPWQVAFALQKDGWYLRQEIIWHKPNACPESVFDRCTKSHEYIFLLSKSSKYYFDSKAISEPATSHIGTNNEKKLRNKRSVWSVPVARFKEAHFATFPTQLIEPCILAGCPEGGTVIDPFGGAGTTALVANRNNRNAILYEINTEYVEMAKKRLLGCIPNLQVDVIKSINLSQT
jgi:site-specific DNA-methyltransferase (adenine-specific)